MQKRILLAVSGMSPQIVTETLFSLATREEDQFIPTDIFLITTADGKKQAEQQLLHPDSGKFHQFCKDYAMPEIAFPAANILVIEDAEGLPLDDIKTPENNEAAADFITRTVRNLTLDPKTALHVSIAGGRKTMGYYLGYALSLYGRRQDRLSHVLVTDRYEGLKDFFYPTPYSQIIFDRDNKSLDAQDAKVMLAEIPFVRLIDGNVPLFLQQEKAGFTDSVRMVQALENKPLLKIDVNATKERRLLVSELELSIPLDDIDFVFYLFAIQSSQNGEAIERKKLPKSPPKFERSVIKGNQDYAQEFLKVYKDNFYESKDSDRTEERLEYGMYQDFVDDRVAAIKKEFTNILGKRAAQPYLIQNMGTKGRGTYYLVTLSDENIQSS
jgi:CRISPR-associated protein (TIGR02584 family)